MPEKLNKELRREVLYTIEWNLKNCLDDINTDVHQLSSLEVYEKLHDALTVMRVVDSRWSINGAVRGELLPISRTGYSSKKLTSQETTVLNAFEQQFKNILDAIDHKGTVEDNRMLYEQLHANLIKMRKLDPQWSIRRLARRGVFNKKFHVYPAKRHT
jgi:hypothetical protein